jgi:enamine deaminase RidA (YjgF/YER057c/UK114 family)
MRNALLAIGVVAAIAAVVLGSELVKSEERPMETGKAVAQGGKAFHIFNPETMAKPTVGYSQVAEVGDGKIVFIAGQIALDKSGNLVGKDDFRTQVQQVFENLKAAVEATGGDFHSVVKLNYYCAVSVDPLQVPVLREVRDKYVNTANPPTSTLVFVPRLARPEWLIEVEAVAVAKK